MQKTQLQTLNHARKLHVNVCCAYLYVNVKAKTLTKRCHVVVYDPIITHGRRPHTRTRVKPHTRTHAYTLSLNVTSFKQQCITCSMHAKSSRALCHVSATSTTANPGVLCVRACAWVWMTLIDWSANVITTAAVYAVAAVGCELVCIYSWCCFNTAATNESSVNTWWRRSFKMQNSTVTSQTTR